MNELKIFNNPEFGMVRMVEINNKDYAVGNDVAESLEYARPRKAIQDHCKGVLTWDVLTNGGAQKMKLIPEGDIYRLVIKAADQSRNPEIKAKAERFERWIFDEVIPELRKMSGASVFDFVADRQIQKALMEKLEKGIPEATKEQYIKANCISNKAVSNMFGYPKMIKKADMPADMLAKREEVLNDTVELMVAVDKFGLDISVSDKIYGKYH